MDCSIDFQFLINMLSMGSITVFVKAMFIHSFIQYKSVIILWEDDHAKQFYLILKVSCRQNDNLSGRYNDHQKIIV